MKIKILAIICLVILIGACSKAHKTGGQPFPVCICHLTDTSQGVLYGLGGNVISADSLKYNHACDSIKQKDSYDTCYFGSEAM